MRLVPKLLLVSIPLTLFWAPVSWYYTSHRGDYYFPDRYEDGYGGMLISVALSALVVIVTIVLHFIGSAKKQGVDDGPLHGLGHLSNIELPGPIETKTQK
jgi:hypothetical protein